MPTLRIVSFDTFNRPVLERDLHTPSTAAPTIALVGETLTFSPPQANPIEAQNQRRFGGSVAVGETHPNGQITAEFYITGDTQDAATALYETVMAALFTYTPGRYLEWRPDGASRSVYFELRGPGTGAPLYRWVEMQALKTLHCSMQFSVSPLAEGDRMTLGEDFQSGTVIDRDWIYDSGSRSLDTVTVGTGLVANTSLTTERRAVYSGRGYPMIDSEGALCFVPDTNSNGDKYGVILCRLDANNYIECYTDDNGTTRRIRIDKVVGGVRTNLANLTAAASRATFNTRYPQWVRGRREGRKLTVEYTGGSNILRPIPGLSDGLSATLSVNLTAAEEATFAAGGYVGFSWKPNTAVAGSPRLIEFNGRPFVYQNNPAVTEIRCDGLIPGSAPAMFDTTFALGPGTGGWPFGHLGWWKPTSRVFNMIPYGDLDIASSVAGWSVASLGNINSAAATSVNAGTTNVRFGTGAGEVVTPATANTGAWYRVYRKFRAGRTYTFDVYVWSAAGTTPVYARLGSAANADVATGTAQALSTNWSKLTVTWTPTADAKFAEVAININAATATTFRFDSACLYEGTVAPAKVLPANGYGAVPPLGVIEAESYHPALTSTKWAPTVDALQNSGYVATLSAYVTGTADSMIWMVDPTLVVPDDFTENELRVEVYGRFKIPTTAVSPVFTLSAGADKPTAASMIRRFSEEWGKNGRIITANTNAKYLYYKLGTISLPVDQEQSRVQLRLDVTMGATSTGNVLFDGLMILPARQRAGSPTGKANDTNYPQFANFGNTTLLSKRITTDLRGKTADQTRAEVRDVYGFDNGWSGQLLEAPPGEIVLMPYATNKVIDDPSDTGSVDEVALAHGIFLDVIPRYRFTR